MRNGAFHREQEVTTSEHRGHSYWVEVMRQLNWHPRIDAVELTIDRIAREQELHDVHDYIPEEKIE